MVASIVKVLALAVPLVAAQNSGSASSSFSPTPVTTTVPKPTAALNSTVPGQGIYPPLQAWCNNGGNDTFCPGVLLQDVQLSGIFPDSKTFVDKPTRNTLNQTLQTFAALGNGNLTVGQVESFVNNSFKGEGLELSQVALEGFNPNPAFLSTIDDPIYKGWMGVVNSYWTLLIRETNRSALCNGDCESSLIPLNNTIVVPGGRYREIYYWDSYWILIGLLESELNAYATDLVLNFMDFIQTYGFIPNGGRKYYLNRSQPPVFTQMLNTYVQRTGNTTILARALPLAHEELVWWENNRVISVPSPYSGITRRVAHFAVNNTAPRPEGYVEDYETAFGASPALNETQRGQLYSDLAAGAESGWDYSSRWCKVPIINVTDNLPALRTINTAQIVPVDLNSLLAGDHALLANLYELYGNSSNANSTVTANSSQLIAQHRQLAQNYSDAVLDLHWDANKAWFYDFNITANERANIYHPGGTFALWQNITPPSVANNETYALEVVSGARFLLGKYTSIPSVATLLETGLNWDFPNSWPPHVYTSIKAFETLGRGFPNASVLGNISLPFSGVMRNQLGLNESQIPAQPASTIGNSTSQIAEASGKPWPQALAIEYANRYMQAAFCSWYSTGGKIDGILTQLPISDLNITGTYQAGTGGVMFEKFNVTDLDAAGGGGEYTVQVGFGWTNGVALWLGANFGQYLPQPTCPLIPIIEIQNGRNASVYQNGTSAPYNASTGGNSTTAKTMSLNAIYAGHRIPRE